MKLSIFAVATAPFVLLATQATAAPVVTAVGTTYTASNPFSFTFGQSTFTLTGTGDIFNPTAISTRGTAQFNTVLGGPTSSFTNRGTVTFGASDQYAAFTSPTTIRFSNGENFIGLRATDAAGQVFYGYAFTTNNVINSYAFESVAGATITASTAIPAAVPEPATWAMMIGGFGVMGVAMRRRRRTTVSFA
ncbi:MAG: PEPxxWA-CTERM sorting domain-containing protein [Pseudomonadota bacterium]